MQVEVPPWVSQWLSAAEWRRRQRERDRRMPGLTLYAYGPYQRDPPKPVLRIGEFPDQHESVEAAVHTDEGWVPLHYPLDSYISHSPHNPSHLTINVHGTNPQRMNPEWGGGTARSPTGPVDGMLSGRAALRAWVFGSALVVLVLVLVRAIDKCLAVNFLKFRRRSREWPTPNVRATNRQQANVSTVMIPDSEGNAPRRVPYGDMLSVDLPPPYSECTAIPPSTHAAPSTSGPKLPAYEDPPPAYSDTYVEFSNKNGVPSVLIYSRRRTPLVNRRDIVGSDTNASDDERPTSSQQNAQNNDPEINGAGDAQREIAEEISYQDINTNNATEIEISNDTDTLHPTDVNIENNTTDTAGDIVASSDQITVDIGEDVNVAKDGEIMV